MLVVDKQVDRMRIFLILVFVGFLSVTTEAEAAQTIYGEIPNSYKANVVEWLTTECIYHNLPYAYIEASVNLITQTCLGQVLSGSFTSADVGQTRDEDEDKND